MRRLPQGLRKVDKNEFVLQMMHSNEKLNKAAFVLESRIGTEWSKLNEEKLPRQSIRW
jgi:hypothetical protein